MSKRQKVYDYMLNEFRFGNYSDEILGTDFQALANDAMWMFGNDYAHADQFLEWAHEVGEYYIYNPEQSMGE